MEVESDLRRKIPFSVPSAALVTTSDCPTVPNLCTSKSPSPASTISKFFRHTMNTGVAMGADRHSVRHASKCFTVTHNYILNNGNACKYSTIPLIRIANYPARPVLPGKHFLTVTVLHLCTAQIFAPDGKYMKGIMY